MLKLVSNRNGEEIHCLEISENGCTIKPEFEEVRKLLDGLTDKREILNALSQFSAEYVWAVTYETPPVPALTRRQFRLALVTNGYNLADIEAVINSIEDATQSQITLIEWQDGTTFERNSQNLIAMAAMLDLSKAQVDALWAQGLTL